MRPNNTSLLNRLRHFSTAAGVFKKFLTGRPGVGSVPQSPRRPFLSMSRTAAFDGSSSKKRRLLSIVFGVRNSGSHRYKHRAVRWPIKTKVDGKFTQNPPPQRPIGNRLFVLHFFRSKCRKIVFTLVYQVLSKIIKIKLAYVIHIIFIMRTKVAPTIFFPNYQISNYEKKNTWSVFFGSIMMLEWNIEYSFSTFFNLYKKYPQNWS